MLDNKDITNKKLLIITGPQGSGNHIFSRLFSLHESVGGWKELNDEYWIPSDLETFAKYWVHPEQLSEFDFSTHDYWVANVSCPSMFDGVRYVPYVSRHDSVFIGPAPVHVHPVIRRRRLGRRLRDEGLGSSVPIERRRFLATRGKKRHEKQRYNHNNINRFPTLKTSHIHPFLRCYRTDSQPIYM